jgi:hypothetical protein
MTLSLKKQVQGVLINITQSGLRVIILCYSSHLFGSNFELTLTTSLIIALRLAFHGYLGVGDKDAYQN